MFLKLHQEFNFQIDLAATDENAKLPAYFTKEGNALLGHWAINSFGNIPYSDPKVWYKKAFEDSVMYQSTIVLLTKAATSENYWEYTRHAHVRFLKGRVKFWDENNKPHYGATFPSAVIIWSPKTHNNHNTSYWDYRGETALRLF